jgi:hypothetical protein
MEIAHRFIWSSVMKFERQILTKTMLSFLGTTDARNAQPSHSWFEIQVRWDLIIGQKHALIIFFSSFFAK